MGSPIGKMETTHDSGGGFQLAELYAKYKKVKQHMRPPEVREFETIYNATYRYIERYRVGKGEDLRRLEAMIGRAKERAKEETLEEKWAIAAAFVRNAKVPPDVRRKSLEVLDRVRRDIEHFAVKDPTKFDEVIKNTLERVRSYTA